jgi:hypothetical protein
MMTLEEEGYGEKTRRFGGFALRGQASWRMRMEMQSSRLKLRRRIHRGKILRLMSYTEIYAESWTWADIERLCIVPRGANPADDAVRAIIVN